MAYNFTNSQVAKLLKEVAAAYEVKGEDRFKIVAYDRAASSVERASSEVKDLWDERKLGDLPGIGTQIASHLDELFQTGKVKHFEEIKLGLPQAMFEFLPLPGIGPKTAYKLCRKLGITEAKNSLSLLEKNAKSGKIRQIEGFGEESEKDILRNLDEYRRRSKRILLADAFRMADDLVQWLKKSPAVKEVEPLGSLRRMVATVGDIDLAVATNKPQEVIKQFAAYPKKARILERGRVNASLLLKSGHQVDLMIEPQESFGALLQHFTGSKQHNIALREYAMEKGLSLSEHGIKRRTTNGKWQMVNFSSEEKFYQALGMGWIPPEIREDTGEIKASLNHQLPQLVELSAIKGDLHVHSSFPIETSHDEGLNTIEEMMDKAQKLHYEYLGFCEHNPSVSQHTSRQIIDIIKRKKEAIEKINYSCEKGVNKIPVRALNGLEIDIKPDGSLGVPEKVLDDLDYAIVSVHSSFRLNKQEMTKRVLAALNHPKVKILGHPTGRKLEQREGFELDWEKIWSFCLKNQKWLEINAWPDRLDLPDFLVREAINNGVKMMINTDSHEVSQMDLMFYGVAVARRGWAQNGDIINTLTYDKIRKSINQ